MGLFPMNVGGGGTAEIASVLEGDSITIDADYSLIIVVSSDNITNYQNTIGYTGSGTTEGRWHFLNTETLIVHNAQSGDTLRNTYSGAHTYHLRAYCFS